MAPFNIMFGRPVESIPYRDATLRTTEFTVDNLPAWLDEFQKIHLKQFHELSENLARTSARVNSKRKHLQFAEGDSVFVHFESKKTHKLTKHTAWVPGVIKKK